MRGWQGGEAQAGGKDTFAQRCGDDRDHAGSLLFSRLWECAGGWTEVCVAAVGPAHHGHFPDAAGRRESGQSPAIFTES